MTNNPTITAVCAAAPPAKSIPYAWSELSNSCDALAERLEVLGTALNSVLREHDTASKQEATGKTSACDLAGSMVIQGEKIDAASRKVQDLIDRLEL